MLRAPPPPERATLWYFAYGSNLNPGTFEGWRGMRPAEVRTGLLRDHELRFDLGAGPGERGVANLCATAGASLWGVLYRIRPGEFEHLDRTEGLPRGSYHRIPVRVLAEGSDPLEAATYLSEKRQPRRRPSRRYLGLLLRGARHHRLPREWIDYLEHLPLAVDERERQQLTLF